MLSFKPGAPRPLADIPAQSARLRSGCTEPAAEGQEVRCGFDEETTYDPWHYVPVLARKLSTKSLIHRHTPSFLIKIKQPRKASAGQKEQLIELSTKSPAGYFDGNMIGGTHGHVGT
jgi:hypothetical protein